MVAVARRRSRATCLQSRCHPCALKRAARHPGFLGQFEAEPDGAFGTSSGPAHKLRYRVRSPAWTAPPYSLPPLVVSGTTQVTRRGKPVTIDYSIK
jgi:hypothetical protein